MTLPATLAGVAAFGLPGVRAPMNATSMRAALSDGEWRALLTAATRERLTPLLAIAADAGALHLTDGQHREAVRAHEQAMRLCVLLERALVEVTDELDAAGVAHRVLKGSAVAHLDFPDPAWRAFGDVDVLVEGPDYDRALGVLTDKGAHRRYHEVRPGFDRRFGKGACVVLADGTQIDVHRTFVSGPFGLTVDLPELFETWTPLSVGGRALRALDPEHRFLHACYHASLGDVPARLVALRDVAQLALAPAFDRDLVSARATSWHAEAVVARAVKLSWSMLGLEPDRALRVGHHASTGSVRDACASGVHRAVAQLCRADRGRAGGGTRRSGQGRVRAGAAPGRS